AFLPAEGIVTAERSTGRGENLILHPGESRGWVNRLPPANSAGGRRQLVELAASYEKQKNNKETLAYPSHRPRQRSMSRGRTPLLPAVRAAGLRCAAEEGVAV